MGRELKTLTVNATVSRHNSTEDDRDDALWDELCERIEALVDEARYLPIRPSV